MLSSSSKCSFKVARMSFTKPSIVCERLLCSCSKRSNSCTSVANTCLQDSSLIEFSSIFLFARAISLSLSSTLSFCFFFLSRSSFLTRFAGKLHSSSSFLYAPNFASASSNSLTATFKAVEESIFFSSASGKSFVRIDCFSSVLLLKSFLLLT